MDNNILCVPVNAKHGKPSVASMLGVSQYTVRRIAKRDPSFPKPIRLTANSYIYKVADIQAWIDAQPTKKEIA